MINWNSYRLSLSRMQSIADVSTHLRATYNFPDDGLMYTDYARTKLDGHVLFGEWRAQCRSYEYVNIRGIICQQCTAGTWQNPGAWHINSYSSRSGAGCQFDGKSQVDFEQNFGLYKNVNPAFRCTANQTSTTQHWVGNTLY